MNRWVDITFDCLPLRTVGRLDVPLDASPKYQQFCQRVKEAMEKHGTHNAYYLYNARCAFHLTNHEDIGLVEFRCEGVVLTDQHDRKCRGSDLNVELAGETCSWLTEPVVDWFLESVRRAVELEFDRYIEAGDLAQAEERIRKIQAASDDADGFLGMYL
jgi:hypothetical protein